MHQEAAPQRPQQDVEGQAEQHQHDVDQDRLEHVEANQIGHLGVAHHRQEEHQEQHQAAEGDVLLQLQHGQGRNGEPAQPGQRPEEGLAEGDGVTPGEEVGEGPQESLPEGGILHGQRG